MSTASLGKRAELRHKVPLALRSQKDLDPIEAWLRLNVKGEWKLGFQGTAMDKGSSRLKVVFCFADEKDAALFQRERGRVAPKDSHAPANLPSGRVAATAAPRSRPMSVAGPQTAPTAGDFLRSAGDLVRSGGQVMASKVQLIGLDKVKAHFGDAWSRVAERADQIAERAIRRRLGERDMMTRIDDLSFFVLFSGIPQDEAQIRCRMIAGEIARQLIGENGSGDLLSVRTGVAPVDGEIRFEDAPSLAALAASFVAADDEVTAEHVDARPAVPEPVPAAADPLADVDFVYRPMWDVRRKVVTSYLCLPSVQLPGGRRVVGENAIIGIEAEPVQRALDIRALRRATDDLCKAFANGRKHLVAVPVHFDTVSTAPRRIDYLGQMRHVCPAVAKLILFEIVGAPEGVPQSRVLEISTALGNRGRSILYRTPIASTNWGDLAQARVVAVGADLSHEHGPETALIERFIKFADLADRRKLGCYLHGLQSLSLTVSAVGAGFHYLSGQSVAALSEVPPEAHRFSLENLYA